MSLTYGAIFTTPLIKHTKNRINKIIKFPCDTKRRIWENAINNSWNTQIVHMLCEISNVNDIFKVNLLIRLPKPVEPTH